MLLSVARREHRRSGRVTAPVLGHFAMPVRVCIVGCGALGSVIGAHLARLDGVEVHAYDVSEEHVCAIREHGLRISGASDFSARLHAVSEAREIPPCEFGIFATKSLHTRAAVGQTAAPMIWATRVMASQPSRTYFTVRSNKMSPERNQ